MLAQGFYKIESEDGRYILSEGKSAGILKQHENGNEELCMFIQHTEFDPNAGVATLYFLFEKMAGKEIWTLSQRFEPKIKGLKYRIGNIQNPSFGTLCNQDAIDAEDDLTFFDGLFLKGNKGVTVGMNDFHFQTILDLTGWH